MRHHPDDVSRFVADACDVQHRPVWIRLRRAFARLVNVPKNNLSFRLQRRQASPLPQSKNPPRAPPAFAVGFFLVKFRRERSLIRFYPQPNRLTDKMQRLIPDQRAGQQPGSHIKSETHCRFQSPAYRRSPPDDGPHDRRKTGNRPTPEIVPVGKSAWQYDRVKTGYGSLFVPEIFGR